HHGVGSNPVRQVELWGHLVGVAVQSRRDHWRREAAERMRAIEVVGLIRIKRPSADESRQLISELVAHFAEQRVLIRRVRLELAKDRLERRIEVALRVCRRDEGFESGLGVLLKNTGHELRTSAQLGGEAQLVGDVLAGVGLVRESVSRAQANDVREESRAERQIE